MAVKETGGVLSPLQNGILPREYSDLLPECVETILGGLPALLPGKKPEMSALTVRLIRAEKKNIR
jgi:hypothetical protein